MKYLYAIILVLLLTVFSLLGIAWMQFQPPEPALVPARTSGHTIANVTIIAPGVARAEHRTIVVKDGRVAEVREASRLERSTPSRYVIPGLVDAHIHQPVAVGGLPEYFALLYLMHGVTSVRYTGYSDTGDEVERHRQRIEDGLIPGPRVFNCGPMIDGEPPLWPAALVLTKPERASATISDLVRSGVDCIKVYSNLKADVLAAVVRAAREEGLRVLGHIPHGVAFEESGINDVQHLIGVPEHGVRDPDTNAMLHGWDALSDERIEAVARFSTQNAVIHTPTLVFLWTNAMRDKHDELVSSTAVAFMPRLFPDVAWIPQESIRLGGTRTGETQDALRAAYRRGMEVVGRFHERGVLIQAGTDTANPFLVPGAALIQEIGLLREAGLDNEAALAAATTVPGRTVGLNGSGLIQEASPADLLVLKRDPTKQLDALEAIELVIADGRIYTSEFLESEVHRYREHFDSFTWDVLLPAWLHLTR